MIQAILSKLKENTKYDNLFDSKHSLSYIMISTGSNRAYEKGRICFLIFLENTPLLAIKFFKSLTNSTNLKNEFDTQKVFYEEFNHISSEPFEILNINNIEILVEEAICGKTLERYFWENPTENSIKSIMKKIIDLYNDIDAHKELSTFNELKKEIEILLDKFLELYRPDDKEIHIINECISLFLQSFNGKQIFQRFSHGDFIPTNIIVNGNDLRLIDFEFAEKTHLYFLEWLRFFKFQNVFPTDYFYEILSSIVDNQYLKFASREFSRYKTQEKIDVAYRFVFEVKDYMVQWSVASPAYKEKIRHRMKKLILELSSRLHENQKIISRNVVGKSAKVSSDKKEFFQQHYKKIRDYYFNLENLTANLQLSLKGKESKIEILQLSLKEKELQIANLQSLLETSQRIFEENNTKFINIIRNKFCIIFFKYSLRSF